MDVFEWLLENGSVLDGSVIVRLLFISLIFQLFGLVGNFIRRV